MCFSTIASMKPWCSQVACHVVYGFGVLRSSSGLGRAWGRAEGGEGGGGRGAAELGGRWQSWGRVW